MRNCQSAILKEKVKTENRFPILVSQCSTIFQCDHCTTTLRTVSDVQQCTIKDCIIDVQSGESEEEEVMAEGIGEQEMEELVPE